MSRTKVRFVCQDCGNETAKWMGRCPGCGAWNTLVEEKEYREPVRRGIMPETAGTAAVKSLSEAGREQGTRDTTGIRELDRVLGGGFVRGSLVLLGGDPGIGKSTLLLQAAEKLAAQERLMYVSGEESLSQIAMRADRLEIRDSDIRILTENRMERILDGILREDPRFVIVDSIQTVFNGELDSAPGTVSQVRECTMALLAEAKGNNRTTILVGHVTKSGELAGPKVLEHMVDAVLYLEGEKNQDYRILRTVKNRFGSTHEIGVFEMKEKGLAGVESVSRLFISDRHAGQSGTVVFPAVEGSRVFLLEVQALAGMSPFGNPRRLATGYDLNRLLLMCAVLEKHMDVSLGNRDIYLNVAGGMKVGEPAADLAVLLALYSTWREKPLPGDMLAVGEVGLTGEIRPCTQIEKRVREGSEMGFGRILVPRRSMERLEKTGNIRVIPVSHLEEAVEAAFRKE